MANTVLTGTLHGVDGLPVGVEVELLRRLPSMVIVGLPGGAVRESQERVRSALNECGIQFPRGRVVVNLAPADLRKLGTGYDLPIAVGILAVAGEVPEDKLADTLFAGELSLQGGLKRFRGALALAQMAAEQGVRRVVLPAECAPEAALVEGVEVWSARDLDQVIAWLRDEGPLDEPPAIHSAHVYDDLDLSEVRGQHRARRAVEVAAAGGHNLLLIGPPGCGKSLIAARIPTILPELRFDEALEVTRIASAANLLGPRAGLITRRPFRAPHHTISASAMVGTADLRPGEATLAHQGVLFLDELPEFRRDVLEVLRAPLEDRRIRLSRARGTIDLPASFSLVAAANPCPCGFAGHPTRACTCAPSAVERYRARISGPLLDRVDLQVWVQPVDPEVLVHGGPGETSAAVRARVKAARERQRLRYGESGPRSNAELSGDAIREAADPTPEALRLLTDTMDTYSLSARAWSRILKVSRTLADLEGEPRVQAEHVLEASSYRVNTGGQP